MANRKAYEECKFEGHKIVSLQVGCVRVSNPRNTASTVTIDQFIPQFSVICSACGLTLEEIQKETREARKKD